MFETGRETTSYNFGQQYEKNYGINPMWIIHNSTSVHESFVNFNLKKCAKDVRTYDFTTLYTSIPHTKLRKELRWVIKEAFRSSKHSFISVYKHNATWTNNIIYLAEICSF